MTRYDGGDLGSTGMDEVPLPGTEFKAVIFTSEKSPGDAALLPLWSPFAWSFCWASLRWP